MVTIAELLQWRPQAIDSLAEYFYDKRRTLLRLPDEIHDARPPATWEGLGTVGAWKTYDAKRISLNDLAAQISDLAVTLKETGKEIKGTQDDLHAVLDEASRSDYSVNHQNGEVDPPAVKVPKPHGGLYAEQDPAAVEAYNRAVAATVERAQEFADRIEKILKRAEMADVGLAKSMADAVSNQTNGGTGSIAEASASQLPPSLDGMSPKEIAEKFGNEIAVDTMIALLEIGIPIYKAIKLDLGGEAQYSVMKNGEVRMSLKTALGISLGEDGGYVEGMISAGGFTDYELMFSSREEAERFLDGLDEAALKGVLGGQSSRQEAVIAYIEKQNVTSAKVGVYGEAGFGFETPYAGGGINGRVEGWYDGKKDGGEFGVKIEASVHGSAGAGDSGVKGAGSIDFAGEVRTDKQGSPKEISLKGMLTGDMANQKFGLDLPGVGSGAGGDVELKMDDKNVMWGEMNEALRKGDMSRVAEIAVDHGSVVVRSTTVGSVEHEIGSVDGSVKQISSQHAWVRPANAGEFVGINPSSVSAPDDRGSRR